MQHFRWSGTFMLAALSMAAFWYSFGDYGLAWHVRAWTTVIVVAAAAATVAIAPHLGKGIHTAFAATAFLVLTIAVIGRPWHGWLDSLNLSPRWDYWTHAGPGGGVLGALPTVIVWTLIGKCGFNMPLREQWGGRLRMTLRDWKVGLSIALGFAALIIPGAALYSGAHWPPHVDPSRAAINGFSNLYEELLCRGLLLQLIARHWGRAPAMAWTSILFGLMHGLGAKSVFIALTSWTFAWAILRCGSLWPGWIIHQAIDTVVDPFLP